MGNTITTDRCVIQEKTTGTKKRWVVTWTANSTSISINVACASKHAAMVLADVLDAPGVLWPC